MYASFRWARGRNYVQKTAALIMIFSLLSTVLGLSSIFSIWLFGPLPILSFPFYEVWAERRLELPQPFEYSYEVDCYDICLATAPVFLFVPQGPVIAGLGHEEGVVQVVSYRIVLLDMEIGAIPSAFVFFPIFLFFIAVNTLGALLGFLISKIRFIQKSRPGSMAFWTPVVLGIIILAYGIWLYTKGTTVLTSPWSRYYHSYSRYSIHYLGGALACVVFGISWVIMTLLDRVRVLRVSNFFTRP